MPLEMFCWLEPLGLYLSLSLNPWQLFPTVKSAWQEDLDIGHPEVRLFVLYTTSAK